MTTSERIEALYRALNEHSHLDMWRCYEPDATFTDPAYGELKGIEIKAMWHQICKRNISLEVSLKQMKPKGDKVEALWTADYIHTYYDAEIHNKVKATFEFSEKGLIQKHTDSYSLWKWSSQALGFMGTYMGWSPMVKNSIRKGVSKSLKEFMRKNKYIF